MNATRTVIMAMVIALAMIGTLGFAAATTVTTYDSSVTLDNKDSCSASGPCTPTPFDGIGGVVEYNIAADEFEWNASGKVPAATAGDDYYLIYYADKSVGWGGDNPGAFIGTIPTDSNGNFSAAGSKNLDMDLPCLPDTNMNDGAKIWMVPSDDYDVVLKKMTTWKPDNYLYETSLITYTDCDIDEESPSWPANATIDVGVTFGGTVPITITDATNVGSVDLIVSFDPAIVTVTGVTNGAMETTGSKFGSGYVQILAYQTYDAGLNGDFTLANLTFTTVGDESCDFVISVTSFLDATPCVRAMPYLINNGTYCPCSNGDVNCDGAVNSGDVMFLAKHIVGITGFETISDCASDVDGIDDVDTNDVVYLARYLLKISGYEVLR